MQHWRRRLPFYFSILYCNEFLITEMCWTSTSLLNWLRSKLRCGWPGETLVWRFASPTTAPPITSSFARMWPNTFGSRMCTSTVFKIFASPPTKSNPLTYESTTIPWWNTRLVSIMTWLALCILKNTLWIFNVVTFPLNLGDIPNITFSWPGYEKSEKWARVLL